jgi:hypothetical protein
MNSLDLSGYPPAPVTWAYNALDTICEPLGCGEWRQWLLPNSLTESGAWFSEQFRLGPVTALLPKLTTYEEFLESSSASTKFSVQSLSQFAFETPSTSLADLTTLSSLVTLFVLVMILRLVKGILLPFFSDLGRKAGRQTHGPAWEKTNEIRIVKFGEYVFRLLFHSCISLAGIYYFWDKEWWTSGGTPSLFMNYPHQEIAPGMTWYYLVQSAYNIDAMVSLLEMSFEVQYCSKNAIMPIRLGWSKSVRGDFQEMFIHHVITNLLIIGSSFFRFTRVGSMVFLVHDISDVPVDLSKLANFLKWKTTTALCFAAMVLVWCLTRLGALPFVIYRSVLWDTWLVCQSGVIDPIYYVHYKPFFVVLVGLLILLHLAWFTMFLQMGWVLVSKGEAHDLSEHKKGETQGSSSSSDKNKAA